MEAIRLFPVNFSVNGWREATTLEQNNAEAGDGKSSEDLSTPLEKLTDGSTTGNGVFDKLMEAVKSHLKEEYDAQRITGSDYADVYMGTMQATLQTSVQFLLNEQQAHQIAAQIGLIRQQTVTELTETCDNIPIGLGFNFIPNETVTIPPVTS